MSTAKILVADDDPVSRRIITRVMGSIGLCSIEASNGKLTWEILRDNPDVSLLITDMMMPEMNGRELIQLIRGNSRFAELPIIIISGIVALREIDDILKLGASRFIPKPVEAEMLKQYAIYLVNRYHEQLVSQPPESSAMSL